MTRVKICGLRREEDVRCVNRCLPEFAGFVFAPSKRRISPRQALELKTLLDPRIRAVGVFVNEFPQRVADLCREGVIDLIQLHGDEDEGYARTLHKLVPCPIIQAVRVGQALPPLPDWADYLLFDTAGADRGGTGQAFPWQVVAPVTRPYFLAGGLHPGNVGPAVNALHPWCVDVSSGVETDGWKDPEKIEEFVARVRKAPLSIQQKG